MINEDKYYAIWSKEKDGWVCESEDISGEYYISDDLDEAVVDSNKEIIYDIRDLILKNIAFHSHGEVMLPDDLTVRKLRDL